MKHKWKRMLLSLLLVLALCLGLVDGIAQAEESLDRRETEAAVETDGISVKGSSDVGNLIANAISEKQAGNYGEGDSENRITGLEFSGNTATVEYDVGDIEAEIVVAVYEKEAGQMTASGKHSVSMGSSSVQMEVEGEIPRYFIASAFLLDADNHKPLGGVFTTELYTKEMVDIQNATTEDFPAEDVLNLDGSSETNFAVYNDETVVAREGSPVNQVVENGDGSYTVSNADAAFKNLSAGDTASYACADGTVLLFKVKHISVNEDTVTIQEDTNADLTDFFDYVKIEADSSDPGSTLTVDNSNLEDGVTYEGMGGAEGAMAAAWEGDVSGTKQVSYKLGKEYENGSGSASLSVEGAFTYGLTVNIKYYLADVHQYLALKINYFTDISVGISGKLEKGIKLGELTVATATPGLYVTLTPTFIVRASGEVKWTGGLEGTLGFAYDSNTGAENLSTQPETVNKIDFTGTLFIGIDCKPALIIISKALCKTEMSVEEGVEFSAEPRDKSSDTDDFVHECEHCFEGEANVVLNTALTTSIFKDRIKKEIPLVNLKWNLGDYYISLDYNEVESGTCPHIRYKVEVSVADKESQPVQGAELSVQNSETGEAVRKLTLDGAESVITESDGKKTIYLPDGTYEVTATAGSSEKTVKVAIDGKKEAVRIVFEKDEEPAGNITWTIKTVDIEGATIDDYGSIQTLRISGSGAMPDYTNVGDAPWLRECYSNAIIHIIIEEGITHIGDYNFSPLDWQGLTDIEIPNSVTSIGDYAFRGKTGLREIKIPDSVTSIGDGAFFDCYNLTSVKLSNGLTKINEAVFAYCPNLTNVTSPSSSSLTSICDRAFLECEKLKNFDIPNSVTSIGGNAFEGCKNLTRMVIPNSVTSIGEGAFLYCENLKYINIPNSITYLEGSVFKDCISLTDITIPDSVIRTGDGVFYGCTGLTSISFPASLKIMNRYNFSGCTNLKSVYFYGDRPQNERGGFISTLDFEGTAYYPKDNDTWTGIEEYNQWAEEEKTGVWKPFDPSAPKSISSDDVAIISSVSANDEDMITDTAGVISIGNDTEIAEQEGTETEFQNTGQTETIIESGSEQGGAVLDLSEGLEMETLPPAEGKTENIGADDILIVEESDFEVFAGSTGSSEAFVSSFTGLVPGAPYVFAAVRDLKYYDLLDSSNLLYIAQANAEADGTVVFTYRPRDNVRGETAVYGVSDSRPDETESEKPEPGQTESETETETEKQTETESKTEKQTETESETEKQTETESETEKQTETESETEKQTETEPETEKQTETEFETEKQTETESETEKQTETESEKQTESETVHSHVFGEWTTISQATIFEAEKQSRTCSVCGQSEIKTVGEKLKSVIKLNVKKFPLQVKKSTNALKVSFTDGDRVVSWKSSDEKIAVVNENGKITGKKTGKAKITVTLASGKKATATVTVQKKKVRTKSIKGISKNVTMKKGGTLTLQPVLGPITSQDKVTFKSSDKKVASVNAKGVVKAKKAGTAKITVKSGKKKVVCKVKVKK